MLLSVRNASTIDVRTRKEVSQIDGIFILVKIWFLRLVAVEELAIPATPQVPLVLTSYHHVFTSTSARDETITMTVAPVPCGKHRAGKLHVARNELILVYRRADTRKT